MDRLVSLGGSRSGIRGVGRRPAGRAAGSDLEQPNGCYAGTEVPGQQDRCETDPRAGTKTAQVLAMLQRKGGATLAEIMEKMGWQRHTVPRVYGRRHEEGWVLRRVLLSGVRGLHVSHHHCPR